MRKDDFDRLVEEARNKNVLEYFRESGYRIDRKGKQHYVTDIPGLVIKADNNQWFYHYENIGRTNNTLDCLTRVVGIDCRRSKQGCCSIICTTGADQVHEVRNRGKETFAI